MKDAKEVFDILFLETALPKKMDKQQKSTITMPE